MEDSRRILCGFYSPGIAEGIPICADQREIAPTSHGCIVLAGLPL
jgi:hypothetical protein